MNICFYSTLQLFNIFPTETFSILDLHNYQLAYNICERILFVYHLAIIILKVEENEMNEDTPILFMRT